MGPCLQYYPYSIYCVICLVKYKRKADETKQTSKSGNPRDMDRNVEDDGFQEEEEQEDEEDHDYDDSQPIRKYKILNFTTPNPYRLFSI